MISNTSTIHLHTDLIEACKQGDRKAQKRLYELYSRAMFNICSRMLGDRAAAEDALQEAFINAFSKLHTFAGRASFGAWLKRIVVNKCLSHLNKSRIKTQPLDQQLTEKADEEFDVEDHDLFLSPERVHQAIKGLPKGCRIVFNLYQLEGYDHQEISEILGVSVSTSKSQLHRAKKLLKDRLRE